MVRYLRIELSEHLSAHQGYSLVVLHRRLIPLEHVHLTRHQHIFAAIATKGSTAAKNMVSCGHQCMSTSSKLVRAAGIEPTFRLGKSQLQCQILLHPRILVCCYCLDDFV